MAPPILTNFSPYTGVVPVIGQSQSEIDQNTGDYLTHISGTQEPQNDNFVDEMNNDVIPYIEEAVLTSTETIEAKDIALAAANYKGDWESDYPDTTSAGYDLGDSVTDSSSGLAYSSKIANNTAPLPNRVSDANWNFLNLFSALPTDTPTISGNTTGTELTDLIVTLTAPEYDVTNTYYISVEAGSYVRVGDEITWTLPTYTGVDDSHIMTIQAQGVGKAISNPVYHTVSVTQATIADQTLLYENATINVTNFPIIVNGSVATNNLVATADDAIFTSILVEQDVGDTDFAQATPTIDSTAKNYTISAGATTTSVTITGATDFVEGDTLLMAKSGTTALSAIDTTSITTDNGGDSYTFDLTGLDFTVATKIVIKNVAQIETSLVATGAADSFIARAVESSTADDIGGEADIESSTDPFVDGLLKAKYRFDNATTDTTGNYDLTSVANITYEAGTFGQRAIFNGTSSKADVPNMGLTNTSDFTLSFRMSSDNTQGNVIDLRNTLGIGIQTSWTGAGQFNVGDWAGNTTCTFSTVANTEYAIMIAFTGTTCNLYVDGVFSQTFTQTRTTGGTADRVGLGADGTNYFGGKLDQLEIYNANYGLTEAQILATQIIDNTPTKITTVFDTDNRNGRDFKSKTFLDKNGDEVSRVEIPIKKTAT